MSDYAKTTNFTAKDALSTGDANKLIKGAEHDTEFDAIAVAIATKADSASPTLTGTPVIDLSGITSAGDLPIADGGTGSSTAAAARTALGLAIGTDVQAQDQALADISGLAVTDGNIIVGDGANWVAESGATARTSLGVDAAGTDNSTDVTLAGTPDYITIAGQVITRGLVDLSTDVTGTLPVANGGTGGATAAAARTGLGLGALAVLNTVATAQIDAAAVTRAKIKTATVTSLAGTIAATSGINSVDITLSPYCFFPMIHTASLGSAKPVLSGHETDGADPDLPRFGFRNMDSTDAATYDVEYRYIDA